MNRGRRSSYRIKIKNSFSRFKNTPDDPLCPDMDSDEDVVVEGVAADVKRKKVDTGGRPRSLNQIFKDNVASRAHPVWKQQTRKTVVPEINASNDVDGMHSPNKRVFNANRKNNNEPSSSVKSILRKMKRNSVDVNETSVEGDDNETADCFTRRSTKKVSFKEEKKVNVQPQKAKGKKEPDFSRPHRVYIIGEDDDDDFVEPVYVRQGNSRASRVRERHVQPNDIHDETQNRHQPIQVNGIRTRISPKPLTGVISRLTLRQASAVEEMGLGSLLDMTVDGIPEKIGYFVVEHLNTETMQLCFGGHTIQITPETISEILGLPNVGIDLAETQEDKRNKVVFTSWRNKYKGRKIRPTDLVSDITSSGRGDNDFRVNFMLLFVSVMGECSPQGCCLMSILHKFSSVEMISNVNWSKYIFDCLRRSKDIWRPNTYESYYTGPLTFLTLLYVTKTVPVGVTVDQTAPPLCVWTMKLLRARQTAEGGLEGAQMRDVGQGQIVPVYTEPPLRAHPTKAKMDGVPYGNENDDKETGVQMTVPFVSDEATDEMGVDTDTNEPMTFDPPNHVVAEDAENEEEQEDSDPEDVDIDMDDLLKEYMIMIENKFATLHEVRWDLEELIGMGKDIFPYEQVFKNYDETKRSIFRDCPTDGEDGEVSEDSIDDDHDDVVGDTKEVGETSFVTPQKEAVAVGDGSDQRSPLSQIWLTQTTYDILDESVKRNQGVTPMSVDGEQQQGESKDTPKTFDSNEIVPFVPKGSGHSMDVIPSFNLGFSPISSCSLPKPAVKVIDELADKQNIQTRTSRATKIGKHLKSPYLRRQVLVGVNVKPQELKIHELCLSAFGGPDEVLYTSESGQRIFRIPMETLAAEEHIYTNVIEGWVDVLNFEERYRSPESPHRYFFSPSVLVGGVLMRNAYGLNQRYQMFHSNIVGETKENADILNMRTYDMVFFPILQGQHYFCVVFNLRSNTIEILDNIERHVNVALYDNAITDLKQLFVHYLKQIQHPSAGTLEHAELRLLEMKWRTKENYVDCGVFLMRHMETYMGGGLRGWFTGLTYECETQKKQLNALRIKYTAKLLLGEYNLLKKEIKEEMDQLTKMGDEAKAQLIHEAEITRKQRLAKY